MIANSKMIKILMSVISLLIDYNL